MPPRIDLLKKHVLGKTFKRQKECYSADITKYAPYVVPSRKPKKVYCAVTKMVLNLDPIEIEKHMKGKVYKRKIEAFEKKLERMKANAPDKDATELIRGEEEESGDGEEEIEEEVEEEVEKEGDEEGGEEEEEDQEEEDQEEEDQEEDDDKAVPKEAPLPLPRRNRPRPNKKKRRKSAHKSQPTAKRTKKE
uniref:Uncharacterized protein n=1 Tax=Arcella intermedia TaxID=1963864 RepID=A0A6B2LJ53_9EUKA